MSDRGAGEILHPIPQWSLFVCTFGFDPCTWSSKEGSEWINATSWCDIYTNLPLLHAGDSINLFRCQKVLSIVPKISKFVQKCSPKLKTSIAFIWYIYIYLLEVIAYFSAFCFVGAAALRKVQTSQGGRGVEWPWCWDFGCFGAGCRDTDWTRFFFKQKVQGVEQNSMVCPIFPLLIAAKIWGSQVLNKGFIKNWGN